MQRAARPHPACPAPPEGPACVGAPGDESALMTMQGRALSLGDKGQCKLLALAALSQIAFQILYDADSEAILRHMLWHWLVKIRYVHHRGPGHSHFQTSEACWIHEQEPLNDKAASNLARLSNQACGEGRCTRTLSMRYILLLCNMLPQLSGAFVYKTRACTLWDRAAPPQGGGGGGIKQGGPAGHV